MKTSAMLRLVSLALAVQLVWGTPIIQPKSATSTAVVLWHGDCQPNPFQSSLTDDGPRCNNGSCLCVLPTSSAGRLDAAFQWKRYGQLC